MSKATKARADGKDDVLRSLAAALTPYLRQSLAPEFENHQYFDQNNSPLGRRLHLALVRKGALPGTKAGKRVLVTQREMRKFLDQHPRSQSAPPTAAPDALDDWGLTRRRH